MVACISTLFVVITITITCVLLINVYLSIRQWVLGWFPSGDPINTSVKCICIQLLPLFFGGTDEHLRVESPACSLSSYFHFH